jgi:hypothetical protein
MKSLDFFATEIDHQPSLTSQPWRIGMRMIRRQREEEDRAKQNKAEESKRKGSSQESVWVSVF